MRQFNLFFFGLLFPTILYCQNSLSVDPRLRIEYWLRNNKEITGTEKSDRAQHIFEKLLKVADKPIEVSPRLYIFSKLKLSQVLALPDGSIILPESTIDFCFREKKNGESRLAFILGHEIKHVVHRDYWQIQTILDFLPDSARYFNRVKFHAIWNKIHWDQIMQSRQIIENEADEYGILYASLAGFDVPAIISEKNNFIYEYSKAAGYETKNALAEKRRKNISNYLAEILDYLDLFKFANLTYLIGSNDSSIDLFYKFVQRYPSKEAYNNLGMCYYQKAFNAYKKMHRNQMEVDPRIVFKLSVGIDPVSGLPFSGPLLKSKEEKEFQESIEKAIACFDEAKSKDDSYEFALNNLGCAYLLQGQVDFAKGYFKKVKKLNPYCKEVYNNLGVAFLIEETQTNQKTSEALTNFLAALSVQSDYPDAIYNLAQLHLLRGQDEEAKKYFERYLTFDHYSYQATGAKKIISDSTEQKSDTINYEVEKLGNKVPPDLLNLNTLKWQEYETTLATVSVYRRSAEKINLFRYQSKYYPTKISIIKTAQDYRGFTARGIRIGDSQSLVEERYPTTHAVRNADNGDFWIYKELGLAFEMQNKKVRNWYLFSLKE